MLQSKTPPNQGNVGYLALRAGGVNKMVRRIVILLALVLPMVGLAGCASREMVLELQGSILYEKPQIRSVTHTVEDRRRDGGAFTVSVRMVADPGLNGSFDISPGIVERQDLRETSSGVYEGIYAFGREVTGGPYTIIGRARHAEAGEVSAKDPVALTIGLPR